MLTWFKKKFMAQNELPSKEDVRIGEIDQKIQTSYDTLNRVALQLTEQASKTALLLKREIEFLQRKISIISENVNDLIIVKTVNKQWVSINPFACEIFGIKRDICIGKTNDEIAEIYPFLKKFLSRMEEVEQKMLKTRNPEYYHVSFDLGGKMLFLDIMLHQIENRDLNTQEIVIIGHNNTPFYESTEKLIRDDKILDNVPYPIIAVDSYEKIFYENLMFASEFNNSFLNEKITSFLNLETWKSVLEWFNTQSRKMVFQWFNFEVTVIPLMKVAYEPPVYFILTFKKNV